MELRQREYLVAVAEELLAVAEELDFRRAAENLRLAQVAITSWVRKLESELGLSPRRAERNDPRIEQALVAVISGAGPAPIPSVYAERLARGRDLL